MIGLPEMKSLHSVHPGEWYFGNEYERVHTVLGSCVALTAWHPQLKLGGMCHYLLSAPPKERAASPDGRYAGFALQQMKLAMLAFAEPAQYQLGLFGGGDMFAYHTPTSIGADNIQFAQLWLARENLRLLHADVGGSVSRSLTIVMSTGEIQVKQYEMKVD